MTARDRSLPQATLTGERTRPKLLAAGAFLLAVLATVMPGSDRVALAQTANVALVTAGGAPIPLNGLYDSGVTLVNAIDNTATVIAISDYKPLKVGLTVEVDSELMTITDLTPGSPATMTVQRPNPVSHVANTHVWANAAPVQLSVSDVGERDTGAKLAAGIDSLVSEASGATLTQWMSSSSTDNSPTVSDGSVLYIGRTATVESEKMYINSVDAGFWGKTGATVAAYVTYNPPNPAADPISISDQSKLTVGWTVQVDSEKMLISALHDGSPPTLDTMTVQRGYDGSTITSHSSGAIIRQIRATLAGDVAYQTVIPISNKTGLAVGQTVRVGLELMHIEALSGTSPPYTMTVERGYLSSSIQEHASGETIFIDSDSGATLAGLDNIDDQVTNGIPISNKDLLTVGQTVRVDFELMQITGLHEGSPDTMDVIRGRPPSSASSHFSGAVIFKQQNSTDTLAAHVESDVTVIPISSKDLLQVGWVALVDDEKMRIEALSGTSPPYTMTVVRGYDNTTVNTHDSGQAIYSGPDRMNVQRGYGGTTAAAHNAGKPISIDLRTLTVDDRSPLKKGSTIRVGNDEYMSIVELPLEQGNTIKVSRGERGSTPASHFNLDHIFDADGLGGYSFAVTTDSVSAYLQPVYARDGDLQRNTFVGSIEIGAECNNAVDDDGDWKINDGCPKVGSKSETGTQCNDAVDAGEDTPADGMVNDGCPGRTLYSPDLQVTGNSLQFSQTTTGTEPGSTGSGTLAIFTVWAKQLTIGTSLNLSDLVSVTLIDVSADVIPSALQSRPVKIVKCPDVDPPPGGPNRVVNINDVYEIAKAMGSGPPFQPKYDIDNNGTVNINDVYIAAAFAFSVPALHCAPPPP